MGLIWDVEIRLLENQRHAQNAGVELNGGLAVRANKGDVVDPLNL
jgi:hypothetical protein